MPDGLRITYVRSAVGRCYRQKRVIRALGFKRLHQSRILPDTPAVRGMLLKVIHLLTVESEIVPESMAVENAAVQAVVTETPATKKSVKRTKKVTEDADA